MDSHPLVAQVRRAVLNRLGVNGIRGITRSFRNMDDNGNLKLDPREFAKGLQDCGVKLNPKEIGELMTLFDTDGDGNVSVDEFLLAIRGGMNQRRKAIVDVAFDKFDKDGSGVIDINDLRNRYDAARNPLVLSKKKTEKEVLTDFLNTFDDKQSPNGVVTREEFHAYYAGISVSIDNDDYFVLMVTSAWNLDRVNNSAPSSRTIASTLPSKVDPTQLITTDSGRKYVRTYAPVGTSRVFMDIACDNSPPQRIVIELAYDVAPKTCENFRALCTGEYGRGLNGMPLHYKGICFHRIIPGLMLQGGDVVRNNGKSGESIYGTRFDDETFVLSHSEPGVVSMANNGPNTNNSQFFIATSAARYLNDRHVAFGKVVRGMEYIHELENHGTDQGIPTRAVVIVDCGEL